MIKAPKDLKGTITLTASKSESNRVLLIRALADKDFPIANLAAAKDTATMLELLASENNVKDVGPAGTTMRFLTAYYAITEGEWVLTGSERMKNRPIHILVDALKKLGADISYLEKEGFPPMKIKGKQLNGGEIDINGSVSSQFLSALIMIAPSLKGGLKMNLVGKVASIPYLKMTLELIAHFGAEYNWTSNCIEISQGRYQSKNFTVEADWSAASYWYQIAALSETAEFEVKGLKQKSLQGDSAIVGMYEQLGVRSVFTEEGVKLIKTKGAKLPEKFDYDFSNCPDVAQTLASTIVALGVSGTFKGLESLRIKETDRIAAIQKELGKFGAKVDIEGDDTIHIHTAPFKNANEFIETYEDHRVAMSIAPLAMKVAPFTIEEPEVVQKSYPAFWDDLIKVGFEIQQ
jgi:3-phosphoshikimate 1-carboxyvinyltransferase